MDTLNFALSIASVISLSPTLRGLLITTVDALVEIMHFVYHPLSFSRIVLYIIALPLMAQSRRIMRLYTGSNPES